MTAQNFSINIERYVRFLEGALEAAEERCKQLAEHNGKLTRQLTDLRSKGKKAGPRTAESPVVESPATAVQ